MEIIDSSVHTSNAVVYFENVACLNSSSRIFEIKILGNLLLYFSSIMEKCGDKIYENAPDRASPVTVRLPRKFESNVMRTFGYNSL